MPFEGKLQAVEIKFLRSMKSVTSRDKSRKAVMAVCGGGGVVVDVVVWCGVVAVVVWEYGVLNQVSTEPAVQMICTRGDDRQKKQSERLRKGRGFTKGKTIKTWN